MECLVLQSIRRPLRHDGRRRSRILWRADGHDTAKEACEACTGELGASIPVNRGDARHITIGLPTHPTAKGLSNKWRALRENARQMTLPMPVTLAEIYNGATKKVNACTHRVRGDRVLLPSFTAARFVREAMLSLCLSLGGVHEACAAIRWDDGRGGRDAAHPRGAGARVTRRVTRPTYPNAAAAE